MLTPEKLQYIRRYRQITQRQIAEATGYSIDMVKKIEYGMENVDEEKYKKWVDALNTLPPSDKHKGRPPKKEADKT